MALSEVRGRTDTVYARVTTVHILQQIVRRGRTLVRNVNGKERISRLLDSQSALEIMKTISIRRFSAKEIDEASKRGEPLGITNAGVLAGVLIPVDQSWVSNLVEWNLSRAVRSVELGEKALDNAEVIPTLAEVLKESGHPSTERPQLRHVSIREVNGSMIAEAAESHELLWITNGRAICGILVPVTPDWVQRLVEQNLSRIMYNVERGEKELRHGVATSTLDEAMKAVTPSSSG